MRSLATVLAALLCATTPLTSASASTRGTLPEQTVYLHAISGDGTSDGYAWLIVTRENSGYRIHGDLESRGGCLALKAVTMHLGTYWGGDQIARSCEPNRYVHVNTWTHHPDVVLTAIIPHGMDWDSHIVTLTGRPDT